MKIEKKQITPEVAKELLLRNKSNRTINPSRVERYAREMREGNWMEDTGELIKISVSGTILDGQHRLHAIIKSGIPIYIHVATNMKDDIFKVIDTGKARNAGDIFKIAGVKNATATSAIVQMYNFLTNKKGMGASASNTQALTPQELLDIYNLNKNYWQDIVKFAYNNYHAFQQVWNMSEIGALTAMFDDVSTVHSKDFIVQVCHGVNVTNPTIGILRNILISDKVNKKHNLSPSVRRALIIKTWNAYYTGKTPKILRFNADIDNYPQIAGL